MPKAVWNLRIVFLFSFALFVLLFFLRSNPGSTQQASRHQQPVPKFALLVGINRYQSGSGINSLTGTHNDVALMASLLSDVFGFKASKKASSATPQTTCDEYTPDSNVKVVCSEQATKIGILNAFDEHLIKNAQSFWKGRTPDPKNGPVVLFYYSGHGSQLRDDRPIEGEKLEDLIKDEADRLDETIVPFDSNANGDRDIRDDSFESRLFKLKAYTENITFISDSCHSGSISRGSGEKRVLRAFPDLDPPISGSRGFGDGLDNLVQDPGYVTISASTPAQLASEDYMSIATETVPKKNGVMTFFLVEALKQDPTLTYRELITLVRTAVANFGKVQTPQAEGAIDRAVFGSAVSSKNPGISIKCAVVSNNSVCSEKMERVSGDSPKSTLRRVRLNAGRLAGAREGGPVVIYSPKAKTLSGDVDKIASGTIVSADTFSSEAEVTLVGKDEDLPLLAKAVIISPGFGDSRTAVAIDLSPSAVDDEGAASMRKLIRELNGNSLLSPVEVREPFGDPAGSMGRTTRPSWELAVVRTSFKNFKSRRENPGDFGRGDPPEDQPGYFISDTNGIPLYDFWVNATNPDASQILLAMLERHVRAKNLKAITNSISNLRRALQINLVRHKSFAVESANACRIQPFSGSEKAAMVGGTPRIRRSEAFHLSITNI